MLAQFVCLLHSTYEMHGMQLNPCIVSYSLLQSLGHCAVLSNVLTFGIDAMQL